MARETKAAANSNAPLSIEELAKKYKELDESRIRAEETLRNAQLQLEAVKERARKEFGTDDIDALRMRLEEMNAENERRRAEFQKNIEEVTTRLAEVEEKYRESKADEGKS